MLIKEYKNCRVCGSKISDSDLVIYLGLHHLHGSFVYKNYPTPPTRKVPVCLVKCQDCHLVQSTHSLDSVLLYEKYGYRSGINAKMTKHLKGLVSEIFYYKKNIEKVLDIACNDLTLLNFYPKNVKKVGVDPCDVGFRAEKDSNTTFINACYPCKELVPKDTYFSGYTNKFDVVTCVAMLYDSNNPVELASRIKDNLKDDGIAIIEVSYWPEKMKKTAVDEICQEHVCFYSLSTLENVLNRAGLNIFRATLNDSNGGSIRVWASKENRVVEDNVKKIKIKEFEDELDLLGPYQIFDENVGKLKSDIQKLFADIKKKKKTVHLYGASTKGNVLLSLCELTNKEIPFAAERNPDKFGGKTLGSNIQIISEEESRKMKPDYYFCPIWAFRDEVLGREKKMIENGTKFIFPLPKLEIVDRMSQECKEK